MFRIKTVFILLISILTAKDGSLKQVDQSSPDPFRQSAVAKIGDNPFPTNPMSARAKGFVDQERVRSLIMEVSSIGIFIPLVYGAITHIYQQYPSLVPCQGIRIPHTSHGRI